MQGAGCRGCGLMDAPVSGLAEDEQLEEREGITLQAGSLLSLRAPSQE